VPPFSIYSCVPSIHLPRSLLLNFRFAFVGYMLILQLFLLYVRFRAKAANDRTPVTVTSPLSSVLQAQLGAGGGGDGGVASGMVKNLASSFLKSELTVVEYDLKQATSMQSGLIINMAFMWFLHFKAGQVQPLLIQAITGLSNIVYSPLFQVYVLGRNLERPFKSPAALRMEEAAAAAAEAADANDEVAGDEPVEEEGEVEEYDSDSEADEDAPQDDGAVDVDEDVSSDGDAEPADDDMDEAVAVEQEVAIVDDAKDVEDDAAADDDAKEEKDGEDSSISANDAEEGKTAVEVGNDEAAESIKDDDSANKEE